MLAESLGRRPRVLITCTVLVQQIKSLSTCFPHSRIMLPLPASSSGKSGFSLTTRRTIGIFFGFFLPFSLLCYFFGPYSIRLYHPPSPSNFQITLDTAQEAPRPSFTPGKPHKAIKDGPRATQVKEAFKHAYEGYMKYAFPFDELLPISSGRVNNFVGWGVTLCDALDTMWIMGLEEEFERAKEFVAGLDFFKGDNYAPFFETIIRHLGGLLSAYALSGDQIFLTKADELGKGLLPAFDTASGFPVYAIVPKTGSVRSGWAGPSTVWSEAMSCQMEYKYLAHLTGKQEYFAKVEHLTDIMVTYASNASHGEGFPVMWNRITGTPQDDRFAVGALADSGYEYFLKQWILSGRSETKVRDLYLRSANQIINKLLFVTPQRQLLYVTDSHSGVPTGVFEHLSCFLSGLFALGVHDLGESHLTPRERDIHLWAAKGLAQTCVTMYRDQETGVGPDEVYMKGYEDWKDGLWMTHYEKWEQEGSKGLPPGLTEAPVERLDEKREYRRKGSNYVLRPETVESLFILWKTTSEEKWREMGWEIFQSIERSTRTQYGYAVVVDVFQSPAQLRDEMPSYFLAETLKYLYLLFSDEDIISLDNFVFNTEAHPFPVFNWTQTERQLYQIQ